MSLVVRVLYSLVGCYVAKYGAISHNFGEISSGLGKLERDLVCYYMVPVVGEE